MMGHRAGIIDTSLWGAKNSFAMQRGDAITAIEHPACRADVPRAELLLTGNRVHSLLDSLLAWAQPRLGLLGHALYVCDEDGTLQWFESVGELSRQEADAR